VPLRVQVPAEDHYEKLIACQAACPVHTDARGYVRAIADGRFEDAYLIARGPNPFASICGRICGAPCEAACRRGTIPRVDDDGRFFANDRPIAIRALKRFACEQAGPRSQARPMRWRPHRRRHRGMAVAPRDLRRSESALARA
jgi:NADPH-dependent glutamate synthase beta subunit-like oxidoreductase